MLFDFFDLPLYLYNDTEGTNQIRYIMSKIKLLGVKTIRTIKKRLLAGETSIAIAKDYPVSSGHIRKIRLGMKDPDHKDARWGYITLEDEGKDDE